MTLEQRLEGTKNKLLKKLFKIMIDKKTNLCVAANFDTLDQVRHFIEKCHQHICILKIQHIVGLPGFHNDFAEELYQLKRKYNFLVFYDGKWVDDSEAIRKKYRNHCQYADLVTVMPSMGSFKGIRQVLEETTLPEDEPRGCLAVCEVSFDDLFCPDPVQLLERSESNIDICCGIIGQKLQVSDRLSMVKMTPGVNLTDTKSGTQNWKTPADVMAIGTDIIIVGRGIISAPEDQLEARCIAYKEACKLD